MTDAPTTDAPVIVDNVEQARHLIAELSAPDAADTLDDGSLIADTIAALEALIAELELAQADTHAGRLADIVTKWADPEPGMLSKLPKPTRKENPKGRCDVCRGYHGLPAVHLDYMGHADVTEALIDADPFWNWRPAAIDHNTGGPVIVREKMATMWGYLTVLGVERMCVGTADGGKEEYAKELIGDLLRNGAMRFGIGLRLWSKADHLDATGDADNELAATTGVTAGTVAGAAAMAFGPTRKLLDRVLPSPGEGPNSKTRSNGHFHVDVHATTAGGRNVVATVAADGDPGYAATAVMLGQSALALALDGEALPDAAGVLTPATGIGEALVDRLVAREFDISVR